METKYHRVEIKLQPELFDGLKIVAKDKGFINVTSYLRWLIYHAIEENKRENEQKSK